VYCLFSAAFRGLESLRKGDRLEVKGGWSIENLPVGELLVVIDVRFDPEGYAIHVLWGAREDQRHDGSNDEQLDKYDANQAEDDQGDGSEGLFHLCGLLVERVFVRTQVV